MSANKATVPVAEVRTVYRGAHRSYLTIGAAWRSIARECLRRDHEHMHPEYDHPLEVCDCESCALTRRNDNSYNNRVTELVDSLKRGEEYRAPYDDDPEPEPRRRAIISEDASEDAGL